MIDRKIDTEKLNDEQLEVAIAAVSTKIEEINKEAIEKANKLLSRYGLACEMQIALKALSKKPDTINNE